MKHEANPLLGVAVLQWNASSHTVALLDDLREMPCVIAVCDNGSEQAHVEALLNYFLSSGQELGHKPLQGTDGFHIFIQNSHNSGFSAGMNLCITTLLEQPLDWVWLLNNDTRVDFESISNLLKSIQDKPPGVYGTRMQGVSSGKISYGNRFNRFTSRYRPISRFSGDYEALGDWYPDGASMLIHREVFERAGLLSEDFFIYFEELDYKRRIGQAG